MIRMQTALAQKIPVLPSLTLNCPALRAIFLPNQLYPLASESQASQEQCSYVLRLPATIPCSTVTWPLKANH